MLKSFVIVLDNHDWGQEMAADAVASGISHGWDIQKISAVDGRTLDMDAYLKSRGLRQFPGHKKQINAMKRPGVFGNLFSHWNLWQMSIDLNQPIGCFEHDIVFHGSPDKLDLNFKHLLKLDRSRQQKNYSTGKCYQGVYAYIIKPEGAKRLIDWGHKNGVMCADVMVGDGVLDIEFDDNNLISFNPKQQSDKHGYTPYSTSKTMTF